MRPRLAAGVPLSGACAYACPPLSSLDDRNKDCAPLKPLWTKGRSGASSDAQGWARLIRGESESSSMRLPGAFNAAGLAPLNALFSAHRIDERAEPVELDFNRVAVA